MLHSCEQTLDRKGPSRITGSKRVRREVGKPSKSGILGIAGLVLLFGNGPSWAQATNPTVSNPNNRDTAGGTSVLINNTTGTDSTGFGFQALEVNTTGAFNTAFGSEALISNTTGGFNTASGVNALVSNTTGNTNTASGVNALFSNTTADGNTAIGAGALENNTTADGNTAIGASAGKKNATGTTNTFIGYAADASADGITNGTALGAGALLFQSNSIVLGNTSTSAIFADVSITAVSDRRRKKDIRALDSDLGLDFIEKLKPVSYRFNTGDETERYGFIAQDLEGALPASLHDTIERSEPEHGLALIERQNDKDRTYRVSYDELLAPIVKSLQQQQQEIAAERQQNADLRHALEDQAAAFKAENEALRHSIETLKKHVTAADGFGNRHSQVARQ
jgi:trimeric autotransporter adhesin